MCLALLFLIYIQYRAAHSFFPALRAIYIEANTIKTRYEQYTNKKSSLFIRADT